jgi:hypothetical protein
MAADVTSLAFDSKVSIFKLGTVGSPTSPQDISEDIADAGVEFPSSWRDVDITTYGSSGLRYNPSIDDSKFTIDFIWNQLTTKGTQTVVGAVHAAKTKVAFEYYPAGATSGNTKLYGDCRCPVFRFMGRVGNAVRIRAEFDVDNGVGFGTAS